MITEKTRNYTKWQPNHNFHVGTDDRGGGRFVMPTIINTMSAHPESRITHKNLSNSSAIQDTSNSHSNGDSNQIQELNVARLNLNVNGRLKSRDRDHLISINTNNSLFNLHKQTISVKNMPSSSSSSPPPLTVVSSANNNHNNTNTSDSASASNSNNNNSGKNNNSSVNISVHSTGNNNTNSNPNPNLLQPFLYSRDTSERIILKVPSGSNSPDLRRERKNPDYNHHHINIQSSDRDCNSDSERVRISTISVTPDNTTNKNSHHHQHQHQRSLSSSTSSIYPESASSASTTLSSSPTNISAITTTDIIHEQTRTQNRIVDDDEIDDYLSLPKNNHNHGVPSSSNNTSKGATGDVFSNAIAYPGQAKSTAYCSSCNESSASQLSHLDSISDVVSNKMEHGFWNYNYSNNFHRHLQRESSFHSYGGFTLNGQPGYNKANKHRLSRICSSHKVAVLVSTFSLIVTIGLIITLILMKKKGMMEAM